MRLEKALFLLLDVLFMPVIIVTAAIALALDDWEDRIKQTERRA